MAAGTGSIPLVGPNAPGTATGVAGLVNDELAELYKRAPLRLKTYGGTAQAITADGDPFDVAVTGGLVDGMLVQLDAQDDNTAADPTLAINTETARPIKDVSGNDIPEGRLRAGVSYVLKYVLASTEFRIIVDGFSSGSMIAFGGPPERTIAAGVIDVTGSSFVQVDTESDLATDDLDTINGGADGQVLVLKSVSVSRDVVVKDNTGNLRLNGDFTLGHNQDTITLIALTAFGWLEIARSDNNV